MTMANDHIAKFFFRFLNLLGCFASILSNGSEKSQSNRTVSHKI